MEPLQFVSEAKLEELRRNVSDNLERYATGDFADLERDNGWAIEARHHGLTCPGLKHRGLCL
ncbi:MAG: hypothetical protein OXQ89_09945, partial [Rhodospirillaceae bacterium]|nr:hypothetical protein [Rhodospirillaceae bacterium]MDD9998052.1 hypothetical protein [Rhodospirillaceae bacterium]MDE0359841.1 hypothetical protein [Rhodospirillaceae bacterium]